MTLAAVIAFCMPVFVDTVAILTWTKNPNIENEAAVAQERVKYQRIALVNHLAAGGVLFVLINVGWSLFARRSTRTD